MSIGSGYREPSLADLVADWAQSEKTARHRQDEYAAVPWLAFGERIGRKRRVKEACLDAARRANRLPENAVQTVAEHLLYRAWTDRAYKISTRHPLHPSLAQNRRDAGLSLIEDVARTEIGGGIMSGAPRVKASDVPGMGEVLTPGFVGRYLDAQAEHVGAIAQDDTLLTMEWVSDGKRLLTIQHKASRMRARFVLPQEPDDIGSVYAKPYHIGSIDPDCPDDDGQSWNVYKGLGIGARIYEEAARLHPAVRWRASSTTDHSAGLRRKLHATDPYRWMSSCDWCRGQDITWSNANEAFYFQHPK